MARSIRAKEISSFELVNLHLERIQKINPLINAVTELLAESALQQARQADKQLAAGDLCGPLHGVPISIKDSIDVAGTTSTAGTLGRRNAQPALQDATLVRRLRAAGAIPLAKTNLPDLLFSFESDNFIFGRTNNPYDLARTPGGSSGGESALISAEGSPLGLGSDAFGSVRVPAAFCGITSIKPTSGCLPRTGHVPPAGGWLEAVWQIGPMTRYTEDLALAMTLLAGQDGLDFTCPPAPLIRDDISTRRIAFFKDNGFARCDQSVQNGVTKCAEFLAQNGFTVEECRPPGIENVYELEFGIAGADGGQGIDAYLAEIGSTRTHPLLNNFLGRFRPFRVESSELARRWTQWDEYRAGMMQFFMRFDAIVCPVYTHPALEHGQSAQQSNFEGFSYTMAWNMAGLPAATVRCSTEDQLPINVQVVTPRWRDLRAVEICRMIEAQFGGWQPPPI